MSPQTPTSTPPSTDSPVKSIDGVVAPKKEASVDNLPAGAVFTEVPSDHGVVSGQKPYVSPTSAVVVQPQIGATVSAAKVSQKTPKIHRQYRPTGPAVAITIATICFIGLAIAAYLAYSSTN